MNPPPPWLLAGLVLEAFTAGVLYFVHVLQQAALLPEPPADEPSWPWPLLLAPLVSLLRLGVSLWVGQAAGSGGMEPTTGGAGAGRHPIGAARTLNVAPVGT